MLTFDDIALADDEVRVLCHRRRLVVTCCALVIVLNHMINILHISCGAIVSHAVRVRYEPLNGPRRSAAHLVQIVATLNFKSILGVLLDYCLLSLLKLHFDVVAQLTTQSIDSLFLRILAHFLTAGRLR